MFLKYFLCLCICTTTLSAVEMDDEYTPASVHDFISQYHKPLNSILTEIKRVDKEFYEDVLMDLSEEIYDFISFYDDENDEQEPQDEADDARFIQAQLHEFELRLRLDSLSLLVPNKNKRSTEAKRLATELYELVLASREEEIIFLRKELAELEAHVTTLQQNREKAIQNKIAEALNDDDRELEY